MIAFYQTLADRLSLGSWLLPQQTQPHRLEASSGFPVCDFVDVAF